MRWQIIPALLLILALLSGTVGWAEGVVSPESATEAPADAIGEPAPGAEQLIQPGAGQTQKVPLYYVLMDCGYAFYGSDKYFSSSVAALPGDPTGSVLDMLSRCMAGLVPQDALIVVRGYHSEVIGSGAPASAADEGAVAQQFRALKDAHTDDNHSSMLDVALGTLADEIVDYAREYDCTLVLVTGGCVNYYKGEPDFLRLEQALGSIREAGATIRAFGLAGEKVQDNLSGHFAPGEYAGVQIVPTEMDDGYNAARTAMMVELARMLAGSAGTQVICGTAASRPEALGLLQTGSADDAVLMFYWSAADGCEVVRSNNEELQSYLEANDIFSERNGCTFMVLKGVYEPNQAKLAAERAALEQLAHDMSALGETLTGALATPMDVANGAQGFDLPQSYDAQKVTLASTNPDVLSVAVVEGRLVITPVAAGEAAVRFGIEGVDAPIETPVHVVDSRIAWSFEDGTSLTTAAGQLLKDGAPVALTVSAYGDIHWTISDKSGRTLSGSSAPQDAGVAVDGANAATDTGEAEEYGLRCTLSTVGAQRTLTLAAEDIGTYNVTVWVCEGEAELNRETRGFSVHCPVDAIGGAALTWPYFKQQDGQRVALTTGGAAANLADYELVVEPTGVVEAYAFADGTGLYLVPVGAGTAQVTLTERGVDAPVGTSMTVQVRALTASAPLWLCIVGAAVCLIALTAAIVIVIGKFAQRSK